MQKVRAKQAMLVVAFKAKAVNKFLKSINILNLSFTANFTFKTTKHYFSTLLSVILRLYF